jgi:hypothetical protein
MNGQNTELRGGVIRHYGNKAGYTEGGKAIVDTMFASPELSGWLGERRYDVEWRDGVYDRLTNAAGPGAPELKRVRIWQLKPDVDPMMKFIGYGESLKNFGEPRPENYETVYDGQPGTNDLDEIFELFNLSHPEGFAGHSLSMSDVVELYDGSGAGGAALCEFHYVDRFGFNQIEFGPEQPQSRTMTM